MGLAQVDGGLCPPLLGRKRGERGGREEGIWNSVSDGPLGQGQGPAGSEGEYQEHTHTICMRTCTHARADDGWKVDKADVNY